MYGRHWSHQGLQGKQYWNDNGPMKIRDERKRVYLQQGEIEDGTVYWFKVRFKIQSEEF